MAIPGESPIFLAIKEPDGIGSSKARTVEFYSMGDGTVSITISIEGEPEESGVIAIVNASELGAVARALPVLGIVPAD